MKKVIAFVRRHREQKPSGDVTDTRWRYSLMNWDMIQEGVSDVVFKDSFAMYRSAKLPSSIASYCHLLLPALQHV